MAKKQQIILTHGAMAPTEQAIKDLKLGEVLVQHAADAKDAALHTVLEEGNAEKLVSFPSKEWVDQKIKDVNTAAGQLESTVSALQTQVDGIDAAYKAADAAMDAAYKAADTKIREDFAAADTAIRGEFAAADTVLEGQITALDARVEVNEGLISGLQTTVSEMDAAYKAADTKIREDFAAADTALEGRVDGKLATKADKTTVEALDGRVAVNEGAITDLKAADTAIRGEFAQADTAIRGEFAAADTALEGRVNTELAKKADKTTVEALDGRVAVNEGAIADLKAADTAMDEAYKAADTAIRGEFAAADTALEGRVDGKLATKANQSDFETLAGRVDVVQGEDTGKSMRTVAAEEAAKEVAKVVAEADADFDTLKEIADWILNDKTGAAALQNDVADLKDVVDGYTGKGAIKSAVDTLAGRVETNEGAITDLKAADTAIRGEFAQADTAIRGEFAAADTALKNELNSEIAKKADKTTVEALDGRVAVNEGAIADLKAADTAIRGEFAQADTAIRGEFAAADTALEGRVNAELAKKADKTTVEALDTRVTNLVTEVEKNEETTAKALTDLDTRVTKVYEDFAAADSALKSELNGEIAKKADKATVEALDGRVAVVEGAYVKTIKYKKADGTYEELVAVNNVIDLSGMVIDGGTY